MAKKTKKEKIKQHIDKSNNRLAKIKAEGNPQLKTVLAYEAQAHASLAVARIIMFALEIDKDDRLDKND